MVKIFVDSKLCTGCGKCVDVCPAGVFEMIGDEKKIASPKNVSECMECHACEAQCPAGAIRME